MAEIGFFVWKLSSMPKDPAELVKICKQYNIKRLAIKLVDGKWPYNVPNGDKPMKEYIEVLQAGEIIVEAWGYHYPQEPGPQGDRVEERREKFGFAAYHFDVEGEWNIPYGQAGAAKTMLGKIKVNGFEAFLCSFRFPSYQPFVPWNAFLNHEAIDGASPQVYWAAAHNAGQQLEASLNEYAVITGKPVHPVGATFGGNFEVNGQVVYWEPTVEDIVEFRLAAEKHGLPRVYWYSLDWVLEKGRFDWLEAATGQAASTPPPDPVPSSDVLEVANCLWVNGRSDHTSAVDNRVVVIRAGQQVRDLHEDSGNWKYVGLDLIKCFVHGDYLEKV